MWLLAGLGNPGAAYADNRHNIGFMAVDTLAERHGHLSFTQKFNAHLASGTIGGEKVILLKPLTFMNLSGQSVGEAARFYKIEPKHVIVFHDELDLPLGKLRVKTGGGHGGHNGLKSIDAHIGQEYHRVRLGIGHPGERDAVSGHVLSDFAKAEFPVVEKLLDVVSDHITLLLASDAAGFMNKVTLATGGEKKPEEKISELKKAKE